MRRKTIKEIQEEREKQRREFVKRMEYEKHKRGITKQKLDYVRVKERKYVRDMNEMYSVIDPTKHIEIADGAATEGKRYCSTKSQWQWEHETDPHGWEKPYTLEDMKEDYVPERRKEKIMFRVGKNIFVADAEITPYRESTYATMSIKGVKYEGWLKMDHLKEEEEYHTPYGIMNGRTIMEVSLATSTRIYTEE